MLSNLLINKLLMNIFHITIILNKKKYYDVITIIYCSKAEQSTNISDTRRTINYYQLN